MIELFSAYWLAIIFMGLLGLSILIYVILDGYDLGVGILMHFASDEDKDTMIASIGPFWDANETWLVLGIGILLVAFPAAHGIILSTLYIPTFIMLGGLILRGVSFDFRAKVKTTQKYIWDTAFSLGSLIVALSQGYMLGSYITGFKHTVYAELFNVLVAVCLVSGYSYVGAAWLIMKTEGTLQKHAVNWARSALIGTTIGMVIVSAATPLMSERIFHRWFTLKHFLLLLPIPLMTAGVIAGLILVLKELPRPSDKYCWIPFAGAIILFILGFHGLAYSFFPFIIPDKLTIWNAASAPESLSVILLGVMVVLPCILTYTFFVYRIFGGKVQKLSYY